MKAPEIVERCRALAETWRDQAAERRERVALDAADFAALREAGFPLLAVPCRYGGAWTDARTTGRPTCEALAVLASVDPSLALVASMHPAVLSYWATTERVDEPHTRAWQQQRDEIFEGVVAGDWWGTITSEPGSGGDVLRTRALARGSEADGWRLTGDKHFGSGSGVTTHMVTTARPEHEALPDLFCLEMPDPPWDGRDGIRLLAAWDGHGMAATQSHAFRFEDFPLRRVACPMTALSGMPQAIAFYECLYTAVVQAVVEAAVAEAARRLAARAGELRPYERVEWTRVNNEAWLVRQAWAGMLGALEQEPAPAETALRGKTVIAELSESILPRIGRVLGGGSFSRRAPFGTWGQDVRALGFLRPPWALAFDQLASFEQIALETGA